MRKTAWLVVGVLLLAATVSAQDTPKAELSVGYSYVRSDANFHGGSVSFAGNFNSWFGVAGDFGGYRVSESGVSGSVLTYTFGPRLSFRSESRITPFVQTLVGGARASAFGGSANSVALLAGGGIDIKASENIAIRAFQVEYVFTRFGGITDHSVRASAGIVFRFGKR